MLRLVGRNSIGCGYPHKTEPHSISSRPSSSGGLPRTSNRLEDGESSNQKHQYHQLTSADFRGFQANEYDLACQAVKSSRPAAIGTLLSAQSSGSESIDDLLDETKYFHFDRCPSSECGDVISASRYNVILGRLNALDDHMQTLAKNFPYRLAQQVQLE